MAAPRPPPVTIGIVGDRDPARLVHWATEAALGHLPEPPRYEWVPTEEVPGGPGARLSRYQGLLISPGSPYRSMEGALLAIRHARESGTPLLGTCGGFQHLVIEVARDLLGIRDAEHAETSPGAPRLAVTPLSCSLAGQSHPVRILPGTRAAALYRSEETVEPFFCTYGLNPEYRAPLEACGLRVSGLGEDGVVRVLELEGHPFFLGTLYVPQAASRPGAPHPILAGLLEAARARAARAL